VSLRSSVRSSAKLLLPPIAIRTARRLLPAPWEYLADRWPRNDSRSASWDDSSVVQTMRDNWDAYKRAVEGTTRLAVTPFSTDTHDFDTHNILMTYGYVLARAAGGKESLSVLDWGGALGHYAVVGASLLPEVSLEFTVKERPDICAAGRTLLPQVSFSSSDDECFSRRYDLVMAIGSLQYNEDWRSISRSLAEAAESWLFISVLPMVHNSRSFVAIQRAQRLGLASDYVSWILNRDEFLEHLESLGCILEREFVALGSSLCRNSTEAIDWSGFLFRRHSRTPPRVDRRP
jgi:putative methyltransferase (TIGR04325 family)